IAPVREKGCLKFLYVVVRPHTHAMRASAVGRLRAARQLRKGFDDDPSTHADYRSVSIAVPSNLGAGADVVGVTDIGRASLQPGYAPASGGLHLADHAHGGRD